MSQTIQLECLKPSAAPTRTCIERPHLLRAHARARTRRWKLRVDPGPAAHDCECAVLLGIASGVVDAISFPRFTCTPEHSFGFAPFTGEPCWRLGSGRPLRGDLSKFHVLRGADGDI